MAVLLIAKYKNQVKPQTHTQLVLVKAYCQLESVKMRLIPAALLLSLCFSVCCLQFRSPHGFHPFVSDPIAEWEKMDADRDGDVSSVIGRAPPVGRGSKPTMPSFPEYVRLPVSKYSIKAFKPGKGHEPLPEWAKEILLVPFPSELKNIPSVEAAAAPKALRPKYLEMLCHIDRIYVRIRREVFKSTEAYKGLKLGKCPVNQGTKDHYYLLHLLKTDCGYQLEVGNNAFFVFFIFFFFLEKGK